MRIQIGRLWVLLAIAAACQAQLFAAEDGSLWVSGNGPSATVVADEKPVVKDTAYANCGETACGCQGTGCGSCAAGGGGACCDPGCDGDPPRGIVGIFGMDSFKGVSDSVLQSNFGAVMGLNAATPVPGLSDYGIGWQLGMTYGVYDIDGRADYSGKRAQSQQQTFVTTGFYRKGNDDQRLSFGLVYDWMLNNNWGYDATNPTLGQWRGQVEYAVGACNGIGLYGSVRDLVSRHTLYSHPVYGTDYLNTRAISQVNLFWHHKFCSGADSWLWVGLPERERLDSTPSDYTGGGGSLGDWIIGANIQVPITERLALYGNAEYMHPSAAAGAFAAIDSTWNVGAGIMWYFGGHAESHSLNGKCWLPYMPVANNSTFLVDQSYEYVPPQPAP